MREPARKSETVFALTGIGTYLAGTSAAGILDRAAGMPRLFSALFHSGMAVLLLLWIRRKGMTERYGLIPPRCRPSRVLFYLPLILTAACQAAFGRIPRISPGEAACFTVSMVSVGFLEEILFRGFLFRALETRYEKRGILLSAAAFSLCHLVNLMNGQHPADTALQMVFAFFAGLALALLFERGKSLIPCIAFHGMLNVLSLFSPEGAQTRAPEGPGSAALIRFGISVLLMAGYAAWLGKHLKEK